MTEWSKQWSMGGDGWIKTNPTAGLPNVDEVLIPKQEAEEKIEELRSVIAQLARDAEKADEKMERKELELCDIRIRAEDRLERLDKAEAQRVQALKQGAEEERERLRGTPAIRAAEDAACKKFDEGGCGCADCAAAAAGWGLRAALDNQERQRIREALLSEKALQAAADKFSPEGPANEAERNEVRIEIEAALDTLDPSGEDCEECGGAGVFYGRHPAAPEAPCLVCNGTGKKPVPHRSREEQEQKRRLTNAVHELASTIGRARVHLNNDASALAKRELNGAAEAIGWLRSALNSHSSGEQGEEPSAFKIEYRVNDARGIHGPFDQDEAERVHAELFESRDPERVRAPVIEFREVGPWLDNEYGDSNVPATDTSEEEGDCDDLCGCSHERFHHDDGREMGVLTHCKVEGCACKRFHNPARTGPAPETGEGDGR